MNGVGKVVQYAEACRSMWGVTRLGQAAMLPGFAAGGLHGAGGQMQVRAPGREQPSAARPQDAVVGAQHFQQAGREHGVAILAALAM